MKIEKIVPISLFTIIILVGLSIFKSYGVGWDENAQITIGEKNYNYLLKNDNSFVNFHDKDYGVGFELPVYALQQFFSTPINQIFFRHFCVHAFFILGLFFLYKALIIFYKNDTNKIYLASLTVLILVLSPRIYADSFFNSKDIILLSVSLLNFFTLLQAIETPTKRNWFIHALSTAFLLDIRIIGLINIVISLAVLIFQLYNKTFSIKHFIQLLFLYLFSSFLVLILIWPYLYSNPLHNFIEAFQHMKKFRWDAEVLFMGNKINSGHLPYYYSLVWIGITTPILYQIGFVIGILFFIKKLSGFFTDKKLDNEKTQLIVIIGLATAPIIAVIIFKSVLYDSWRQLFYIYPYWVIISVYGIYHLYQFTKNKVFTKATIALILIFQLGAVLFFMITNHPYQNVYFNEIISKQPNYLLTNYERDYWGVSYRYALVALEKIVSEKTSKDTVYVMVDHIPGKANTVFLNSKNPKKIIVYIKGNLPENSTIDYFITTYRGAENAYSKCTKKVWTANIQNSEVVSIFDVSENNRCYE